MATYRDQPSRREIITYTESHELMKNKSQLFIPSSRRPNVYPNGSASKIYGTFSGKEGGSDGKEGGSDGNENHWTSPLVVTTRINPLMAA
jgi:hypothetical protein